jgi:hypothetical protein
LYFLTVTMMKTGSVFNNQAGSNIDTKWKWCFHPWIN